MPMKNNGLAKLVEECGELMQVAGKKINFPDTDEHPDCDGSMKQRLEEEIADVMAACAFVTQKFDLDLENMTMRKHFKLTRYRLWDRQS